MNLLIKNGDRKGGICMFRRFLKNKNGDVAMYIVVIAIILIIGYKFFSFLKLSNTSQTEDVVVDGVDYVLENKKEKPNIGNGETGAGSIAISDETQRINDVMKPPKIIISPESEEYFYSYNDTVKIKAEAVKGNAYIPKNPLSCKWRGVNYDGKACEIPQDVKLKVGDNIISVTLCDVRKACATSERKIRLGYKDPMLIIHEEWNNYVVNSESGDWKYDKTTNTIHSTKNVNWSGYWNPADKELTNYDLSFKMQVTSPDGDDDTIGFTFRMQDTNNFYFLAVDNRDVNGGAIHSGLYKHVNGKRTLVKDLMPLQWKRNQWMDVRIKVTNNHIESWIGGTKVVDVYDNSFSKGGYGPFSYSQAYARYKDLKISF